MRLVIVIGEDLLLTHILIVSFTMVSVGDGLGSVDQPGGIVVGTIGGVGDFLEFTETGETVVGV